MKKYIILIFIISKVYSQNNEKLFLDLIKSNKSYVEVNTTKRNIMPLCLGKDSFKSVNKTKILELSNGNKNKSEYCLIPLYSINNYTIYTLQRTKLLSDYKKRVVIDIPNAIGYYIVYNLDNNSLYYICSETTFGSMSYIAKNKLSFNFNLLDVRSKIIKLNDSLMPNSAFSSLRNEESSKTYFYCSNYYFKDNIFRKKTKKLHLKEYETIFSLSSNEIFSILENKIENYDFDVPACDNIGCDSEIPKLFN